MSCLEQINDFRRLWRKRDLPNLVIISPKYEYFKANNSNKVIDGVLAKALNFFKNNKVFESEGKREKCSGDGEDMAVLLTNLKALHELFFNGGYHDVTHVPVSLKARNIFYNDISIFFLLLIYVF